MLAACAFVYLLFINRLKSRKDLKRLTIKDRHMVKLLRQEQTVKSRPGREGRPINPSSGPSAAARAARSSACACGCRAGARSCPGLLPESLSPRRAAPPGDGPGWQCQGRRFPLGPWPPRGEGSRVRAGPGQLVWGQPEELPCSPGAPGPTAWAALRFSAPQLPSSQVVPRLSGLL